MNSSITPLIKPLKFPLGLVHPLLEDPALEALYLFDGREGGVRLLTDSDWGASEVTSSFFTEGVDIWKSRLNDNDNTLVALLPKSHGDEYFEIDFGAGNEKEIVKWSMYVNNLCLNVKIILAYSDTAGSGYLGASNLLVTTAEEQLLEITHDSVGKHRYWRMTVNQGGPLGGEIREFNLYERAGRSDTLINYANSNHGIINGALWRGNSLAFDGDDYVDLGSVVFGTNTYDYAAPITYACLVKIPSVPSGNECIIGKSNADIGCRVMVTNTQKLKFNLTHSVDTTYVIVRTSDDLFRLNEWQTLIATYDGSKNRSGIKLYLNGIETSSYTEGGQASLMYTTDNCYYDFQLGGSGKGNQLFNGNIGAFGLYTREFNANEVSEWHQIAMGLV